MTSFIISIHTAREILTFLLTYLLIYINYLLIYEFVLFSCSMLVLGTVEYCPGATLAVGTSFYFLLFTLQSNNLYILYFLILVTCKFAVIQTCIHTIDQLLHFAVTFLWLLNGLLSVYSNAFVYSSLVLCQPDGGYPQTVKWPRFRSLDTRESIVRPLLVCCATV